MSKQACKCKEVECEECPEWIFTLADLIMCMMGLFVILWVLKPAPGKASAPEADEEWLRTVAQIREAFGHVPHPDSTDPVDIVILRRKLQGMQSWKGEGAGGRTHLERRGAEGDNPEVLTVRRGNHAILGTRVLFAAGDAGLNAEARNILDQIAVELRGHRNVVLVNGHAASDDFGEGATAEQKLDLSIRRAKAAAEYLVSKGVTPDTLRVLGASTYEPVAQRAYTPEARQLNRRVEIEELRVLVEELKDPPPRALPAGAGRGAADDPSHSPASQPARGP